MSAPRPKDELYDVAIIGGGINGTGLARDLAMRGLKVVLFEKGDLGQGATGASSAMIHGGPRYLLNDPKVTEHACVDSGHIQNMMPHLLFRVPFLIPIPKDGEFGPFGLWLADAFCQVYDGYARLKNGVPHARLSAAELHAIEPRLQGNFLGAVTLDEWGTDPMRMCVLNARSAQEYGARIHTYTAVEDLWVDDKASQNLRGLTIRADDGQRWQIRAKVVANCTGAWAQRLAERFGSKLYIRPGKGVHLVFARRLNDFAVVMNAVDGREMFMMPYHNETWIGTTDDDYYGDPDNIEVTHDEVCYLLEAAERMMPGISKQRLIGTRVGLRNTIGQWGKYESALSRKFAIIDHQVDGQAGLYSILGGKLASYRVQAETLADKICVGLNVQERCRTHLEPLPGGDSTPTVDALYERYPIDARVASRLIYRHGSIAETILESARSQADGFEVVDSWEPVITAEIRYVCEHEWVLRGSDLMQRCRVGMGPDMGMNSAHRTSQIAAEALGLDEASRVHFLSQLLQARFTSARPVMSGTQLRQFALWKRWSQHVLEGAA